MTIPSPTLIQNKMTMINVWWLSRWSILNTWFILVMWGSVTSNHYHAYTTSISLTAYTVQGEYNKWYIHEINHKQFQTMIVLVITRYLWRVIISECGAFNPISFGDLHPEIQPFNNERWKPSWSTFHIVNWGCMDECSRIRPLCFHLSLFKWLYLWM